MRVWLLVYGVLYVVIEMIGHSLASVGWPQVTALDVATAVTDAFLAVSLALAAILGLKLAARRWGPALAARLHTAGLVEVFPTAPLGVRSWRADPVALPAAPAPAPARPPVRGTYEVGASGSVWRRRDRRVAPSFPEEPGHLL
ncbi:hypothetical protein GCU60_08030 [Blastococcus saxobsidens]|uniref:Uncharacterized protein n=1 Tax=Blastococcus saxobsidens TaxID=138336 RepID=A0A6L9W2K6_9ACTN|nr:hypothetical protein [Blastococcus saxobsidens]NEK85710.1 hypothetical protein [Blastococcus saxobsidens]